MGGNNPIIARGLTLALGLALSTGAMGEGLHLGGGTPDRMTRFRQQTSLLDKRYGAEFGAAAAKTSATRAGRVNTYYRAIYLARARAAALRHGVPEDLFLRLVTRESGWNPKAVSPKGAVGLAQLMPKTAALLGIDINDPVTNLDGGARYLKMMYDRFGSWRLALAAYNAGPKAVEAAGGVPNYAETVAYVAAILG